MQNLFLFQWCFCSRCQLPSFLLRSKNIVAKYLVELANENGLAGFFNKNKKRNVKFPIIDIIFVLTTRNLTARKTPHYALYLTWITKTECKRCNFGFFFCCVCAILLATIFLYCFILLICTWHKNMLVIIGHVVGATMSYMGK